MKRLVLIILLLAAATFSRAEAGRIRTRQVPATLDLRERARASLNYLTRQPDRAQGMLPYFWTFFGDGPPELRHNHWDYAENPGRFLYGLIAARQVTGSLEGINEERLFQQEIYSRMREEGNCLTWRPAYSPFSRTRNLPEMNLWDNRSQFMGLLSLYMAYEEPEVRAKLEGMIDGLEKYGIRRDKYFFFEREDIQPGHVVNPQHEPRVGQHSTGWITPLVKYYQVAGSPRALELARGLADFTVDFHKTSVRPGRTLGISNVHGALFALGGVIRTAAVTGDREHIEWARRLIDYAADNLASDFGWVQEMEGRDWMKPEDSHSTETCTIVDMLQCALLLAENGYPQYWDLVERYVRNYFTEAQITDTGWMAGEGLREDDVQSSFTDVASRVRGCFVGWGAPNDLVDSRARVKNAIQNCCGPHGAWGLFLVWHRITTESENEIRVNLALNKETAACRIASWVPYEGRVEVTLYRDSRLLVRVPPNEDKSKVRCLVDGKAVKTAWDGDYADFGRLSAWQAVTLIYPQKQELRKETLDGIEYKVEWKGATVLSIDPPGRNVPIFQRESFRESSAPMKTEPDPVYRPEIDRALMEIDW
ncbi:MAG: beta-L-arabinofuranosidase domain-containing protein [Candidatus Glassbacteria bacterium]